MGAGNLLNYHFNANDPNYQAHWTEHADAFFSVLAPAAVLGFSENGIRGRTGGRWNVTKAGLAAVEGHLRSIDALGNEAPQNSAMLARLKAGKTSQSDINFYEHELLEAGYRARGLDQEGAHAQTLKAQGLDPNKPESVSELYHPDVIRDNPSVFNKAVREAAGVE